MICDVLMCAAVLVCLLSLLNSVDAHQSQVNYGRAVQLVAPDDSHTLLKISTQHLELLKQIEAPLSIIAVVGNIHSGKSFFLNQILGSTSGFELGYFVEPKTSGLWWWSQPLKHEGTNILLLDTEGFAGPNVTERYDAKLFALAMLLSTEMVYNTMKFIDQDALDRLELLSRRANLFGLKAIETGGAAGASTGAAKGSIMSQYLESMAPTALTWVVQDFVQDLGSYTATQWLNHLIDSSKTSNSTSSLRSLFSRVECNVLPSPINDDTLLQRLDSVSPAELNPAYREAMREFRQRLLPQVASCPKRKPAAGEKWSDAGEDGSNESKAGIPKGHRHMNGKDVASLLQFLVDSLNTGDDVGLPQKTIFPEIPRVWEQFSHFQLTMLSNDLISAYDKEMDVVNSAHPPLLDSEVAELHAGVEGKILQVWAFNSAGVEHVAQSVKRGLLDDLDSRREKVEADSCQKMKRYCSDLATLSLTATGKRIIELKQMMPLSPDTLHRSLASIIGSGILSFRDSLGGAQTDVASSASNQLAGNIELGPTEWGRYFTGSSCCRFLIVDFEQEMQRERSSAENANTKALHSALDQASERAKTDFSHQVQALQVHVS
eukprot:GHVN01069779.1.p1 GENE.GHVN01069779.1~~GHVN01069779.1.p1  ORF type:complete len:604 (+),score=71.43 GHVN01069779.1:59-1870(+)